MSEPPPRVRVASPHTERPRARPRTSARQEVEEQSELGAIYLAALLRSQLRLALGTMAALALTIGMLPLLFHFFPELTARRVGGMPLTWGMLAFGCYPVLVFLAWRYVRAAERNERSFAQVLDR